MTEPPCTIDFFPIHQIGAALAAEHEPEQMGSKQKFWFCLASRWYLFKYSRPNTGEHWSEKIACEIARALGLPHAEVELATYSGAWGARVEDVRENREQLSLLHGNELLSSKLDRLRASPGLCARTDLL